LYLFLDTETAGLPIDYSAPATETDNWPRLVQIAGGARAKGDHLVPIEWRLGWAPVKASGGDLFSFGRHQVGPSWPRITTWQSLLSVGVDRVAGSSPLGARRHVRDA